MISSTAIILTSCVILYFTCALALTFWSKAKPFKNSTMSAADYRIYEESIGVDFTQEYTFRPHKFTAEDGTKLVARRYGPEKAKDVFILVHGMVSPGERWNRPAGHLSTSTGTEVVVFDLRGHGESGGARYDVDYIGQYEDDIANIASSLLKEQPGRRVFLAGHSMGGGIVLRYALKSEAPDISGYLLLAPNFGTGPTQRPRASDATVDPVMSINTARLMGLVMLNMVGIKRFNHLPAMSFNAPPEMPAYSYRALATAQPSPPQSTPKALTAVNAPLLLIVGAEDELFLAEKYEEIVSSNSSGKTIVVPGHSHVSFLNDPVTYSHVTAWFETIAPPQQDERVDNRMSRAQ